MQRQLDEKTLVDGQIAPGDVATLKALGVTLIVNNRPDGEDANQPTSDEIEAAAKEHGLDYRHVPIARGLGPSDIEAMREAMHSVGEGKLFLFGPEILFRAQPHGTFKLFFNGIYYGTADDERLR